MLPIFILFFLFTILISTLTTIPISIAILVVYAVMFKKPWVFFAAFIFGLFLDLSLLAPLGQTGLVLTIFVFLIRLYERKFETQTLTFVFFATFLGCFVYLKIFDYQQILLQSLISSLLAILLFNLIQRSNVQTQK